MIKYFVINKNNSEEYEEVDESEFMLLKELVASGVLFMDNSQLGVSDIDKFREVVLEDDK